MIRLAITVAMMACSACHASSNAADRALQNTAEAGRHAGALSLKALSELVGASCGDPQTGRDCVSGNLDSGDFQTVELKPECGASGTFGHIVAPKASVMNRTPPNDTAEVGQFPNGLKVCVRAIAREGQSVGYYFVTPVDCLAKATDAHDDKCTSGWVDSGDMDLVP